jgi:hypothetical protein
MLASVACEHLSVAVQTLCCMQRGAFAWILRQTAATDRMLCSGACAGVAVSWWQHASALSHQLGGARHADAHLAVVAELQAAVQGGVQDGLILLHLQHRAARVMLNLNLLYRRSNAVIADQQCGQSLSVIRDLTPRGHELQRGRGADDPACADL